MWWNAWADPSACDEDGPLRAFRPLTEEDQDDDRDSQQEARDEA
jgi:hypothetical protein